MGTNPGNPFNLTQEEMDTFNAIQDYNHTDGPVDTNTTPHTPQKQMTVLHAPNYFGVDPQLLSAANSPAPSSHPGDLGSGTMSDDQDMSFANPSTNEGDFCLYPDPTTCSPQHQQQGSSASPTPYGALYPEHHSSHHHDRRPDLFPSHVPELRLTQSHSPFAIQTSLTHAHSISNQQRDLYVHPHLRHQLLGHRRSLSVPPEDLYTCSRPTPTYPSHQNYMPPHLDMDLHALRPQLQAHVHADIAPRVIFTRGNTPLGESTALHHPRRSNNSNRSKNAIAKASKTAPSTPKRAGLLKSVQRRIVNAELRKGVKLTTGTGRLSSSASHSAPTSNPSPVFAPGHEMAVPAEQGRYALRRALTQPVAASPGPTSAPACTRTSPPLPSPSDSAASDDDAEMRLDHVAWADSPLLPQHHDVDSFDEDESGESEPFCAQSYSLKGASVPPPAWVADIKETLDRIIARIDVQVSGSSINLEEEGKHNMTRERGELSTNYSGVRDPFIDILHRLHRIIEKFSEDVEYARGSFGCAPKILLQEPEKDGEEVQE